MNDLHRSAIENLISTVKDHLDKAEFGLKRLHDMQANKVYGLTWEAFMQKYFARSARWLYDQIHALEVRETLLAALPEKDCTIVQELPVTVLREFAKGQRSVWLDIYETAQQIALEQDKTITAAVVTEAATVYSEAIEQASVYGVPLVEVVATGACEERRGRIAAHGKRVYLLKDRISKWDFRGDSFILDVGDIGEIDITEYYLHIDVWYEADERAADHV